MFVFGTLPAVAYIAPAGGSEHPPGGGLIEQVAVRVAVGVGVFSTASLPPAPSGWFISTTATDSTGNTSEFSPALAIDFASLASNGTLNAGGTNSSDSMTISVVGTKVRVSLNGQIRQFRQTSVRRVRAALFNGNDALTIGAGIGGIYADGGNGNDILNGSSGNDTMIGGGGTGRDTLIGNNGNDSLIGDGGVDRLLGLAGFDTLLAREVALKVLREPVFAVGGFRALFEQEARHVGRLEHPSIVPVHDLGELPDGRPFFVMKLIHGQTLAALLAAQWRQVRRHPPRLWRQVDILERLGMADHNQAERVHF
jgi:serine/threonine protein kinase